MQMIAPHKVALKEFRRKIQYLFSAINCDYRACMSAHELSGWIDCTASIRDDVALCTCDSASTEDLKAHAEAIKKANCQIADAILHFKQSSSINRTLSLKRQARAAI